jgi:hypothetical protein
MSETTTTTEAAPRLVRRTVRKRRAVTRTRATRTADDAAKAGVGAAAQDLGQAAPAREEAGDEQVRRVSRNDREVNRFDVPKHRIKPGWDVKWDTITVMGQPVDGAYLREIYDGGWRPEKARDWPEMVAPGTPPDAAVEQFGQRLYGRPKALTIQAKDEDYQAATKQLRDRAQGAQHGQVKGGDGLSDMGRLVETVPLGVSIEGEVGSAGRVLRQR